MHNIFKIFYCIFISGFFLSCSHEPVLVYKAKREHFSASIRAVGELEAKNSSFILTPNIRWVRPKIAKIVPEATLVKKGDIVVELEADEIQRQYVNALDEVAIARADARRIEADLLMQRLLLESQVKMLETSVATSKLQLTRLQFEPPRVQEKKRLEMEQDELELAKNRKKLQSLDTIQDQERTKSRLKIQQEELKLTQASEYLKTLKLCAPSEGMVIFEENWSNGEKVKAGDQLYPNMPIARIPDLSVMQVLLKINEQDAQKIQKNDKVIVTIPTQDNITYTGSVIRIDQIAKPIRRDSKVKIVEAVVEIDSTRAGLMPGMTVVCQIIVDQFENVIAVPHECVFQQDSITVIYDRKKNHFEAVPVSILYQSLDFAVLSGDVGDHVECALEDPGHSQMAPDLKKQ
jgi:hypothetical protein